MKKNKKINKKKNNMEKKIYTAALSSMMILGTCTPTFAAPLAKLPTIPNNSLVLGRHLFELDSATTSEYNLTSFVRASKTVDSSNGIYYKFNGKWYSGKDIENFTNLKKAKGVDTISNDILEINGKDVKEFMNNVTLDWYQDGNYSAKNSKNASVEQFVVYFNKPIKKDVGKLKLVVPNSQGKDPYGKDKLGVIEGNLDGKPKQQALEKIKDGAKSTLFVLKDKGKKEVKEGYTDRLVIELTEDWTRILNTEKTGINYYDKKIKGIRLIAEGLEDENGNKVNVTAKRDINLEEDKQAPYIVDNEPIYTQIGENGTQIAGKTRILFNEPIQLLTEKNVEELKKINASQPYVVGSVSKGKYVGYNPITPSQEQLKSKDKGVPVFKAEYRKVDGNGKPVLDKQGKEQIIKGIYSKRGNVFESDEAIEDKGDKIKLRLNQLKFKYDFDENNKGISRFRDYGTVLISPQECLTEGKWQLMVKNITDDAGNKMKDYVSDPINITKYFDIVDLTANKIKIKFTKPFKKTALWGNKVPVAVTNDTGKPYGFTWIENLKDGQTEAESTFKKPIEDLKGTVYVNTMEYKVKKQSTNTTQEQNQQNTKPATTSTYKDGEYEGEGTGFGGTTKVKVTIEDGKVKNVDILSNNDTPNFFERAKNAIIPKILKKQTTNVDAVSNATLSSNGIKDAVSNALEKAKVSTNNHNENQTKTAVKANLNWYQDGNFSGNNPQDASVEQFVVYLDKKVKANKGSLKIIVPDNSKQDPYRKDKLGEIEVKMDCSGEAKPLANVPGGKPVSCMLIGKDPKGAIDRFTLELNRDWSEILNTKETGIRYYDDRVKGLKLVAEGLEDENGNPIEKIVAQKDLKLSEDKSKPHVVAEKVLYSKIGENGVQPSGQMGIVFNEPVQLFTQDMVAAGVKPSETHVGNDPLTPSQIQKEKYNKGLPVFKAYYEKLDKDGNVAKDSKGNYITIKGKDALMGTILPKEGNGEPDEEAITFKINEINHNFDLDKGNTDISRFRDYGVYFIDPEVSLPEGKWRLVVSGISDDAGNEMDEYKSKPFDITPCFTIKSLTKEGIKVKFTGEGFKANPIIGNNVTVVLVQNGKMVDAVVLENLKDGQKEAEAKFDEPLNKLEGTYIINNMEYKVDNTQQSTNNNQSNKQDENKKKTH